MSKIALVTGANQGLGLAVVRHLCRELGDSSVVYLTARDRSRGEAALRELYREGVTPSFYLLDVTDDGSVAAAAEMVRERHGGIDIVISNAAARISPDVPAAGQVAGFVDTNNHGTYRLLRAFLPLLNDGARVLVVASSFGSLRNLAPELHHHFDVERLGLEDVEAVMDNYVRSTESGKAAEHGWPEWINIPSKIGQVASAKIASRMVDQRQGGRGILVNAVCPGLIDTPASRPWFPDMSGAATPDEAAGDLVWLATLPAGATEPAGELVQYRRILPFR